MHKSLRARRKQAVGVWCAGTRPFFRGVLPTFVCYMVLQELVEEGTKMVVLNFPHNPTGCLPTQEEWQALVACCSSRGAWLFSDEMYRHLGAPPSQAWCSRVGWWCGGVVVWWCGGVVVWWCGGVVAWWCGVVLVWFGGVVVWWWCGLVVWGCGGVVVW
jgi:hypothetical protein